MSLSTYQERVLNVVGTLSRIPVTPPLDRLLYYLARVYPEIKEYVHEQSQVDVSPFSEVAVLIRYIRENGKRERKWTYLPG